MAADAPALAPPAELGFCPQRLGRLRAAFQSEIDRQRLPGAVMVVARHGRFAVCDSLGRQDPAHATPMAPDALFRIYSMTKPLVSVAAMVQVEQGALLLSDPITRWLPEFASTPVAVEVDGVVQLRPVGQPATVQDLLRHTAGFTYEFLGSAPVQRQYAQVQIASRERTNAAFSAQLAALPLMYPPGTVWEYSRATDVLGRLLEVVTGQPLGQHLQRTILDPLGMRDTGFAVPPEHHHRIAEPLAHDPDGGIPLRVLDPRRVPAMEAGGGGLVSTAADYARFLQCLLNGGELDGVRLLSPHTVAFMTADHLGPMPAMGTLLPPGHGFGLGFAVRTALGQSPVPGSVGTYHWSGIAGTSFFVDPALDLFGILMVQAPNQREQYRALFRNLVYAALVN
jgi:CubicO group peptidase (beta-lactamase class C family)